jgi:hypothetical protein
MEQAPWHVGGVQPLISACPGANEADEQLPALF